MFDSGEDAARIGGPDERLWIGVGTGDKAVDCVLEVIDRAKDTTLQSPPCEFSEEALSGIEPGCLGRGEVGSPTWMAASHVFILGCLWVA